MAIDRTAGYILIVDDEDDIRKLLEKVLQKEGYKTLTASSGIDALVLAQDNTISLVITDIRMPGISGLDLLMQLHEMDSQLPIVVISGYGGHATALESLDRGAFFFIHKPFTGESLLKTVEQGLRLPRIAVSEYKTCLHTSHTMKFSQPDSGSGYAETINHHIATVANVMGYPIKQSSGIVPFIVDEILMRAVEKSDTGDIKTRVSITSEKITVSVEAQEGSFSKNDISGKFEDLDITNIEGVGMMMAMRYADKLSFSNNGSKAKAIISNMGKK